MCAVDRRHDLLLDGARVLSIRQDLCDVQQRRHNRVGSVCLRREVGADILVRDQERPCFQLPASEPRS